MPSESPVMPSYPTSEHEKRDAIDSLFDDWTAAFEASSDPFVSAAAGDIVRDGFYPYYFSQPTRILFVGREARGIQGCSYIEVLHDAYRRTKQIGSRGLNVDKFQSRKLYIAWGLLHGMPDWDEIPQACEIGDTFATGSGISFAFMNLSKFSNEGVNWQSDWMAIKASHDASVLQRNFLREQVALLEPDIVITMNLAGRLESLGNLDPIARTSDVNSYWMDTNGHRSLVLDSWHFSLVRNCEKWFYRPICEATRRSGIALGSSRK